MSGFGSPHPQASQPTPPPGWYTEPSNPFLHRWWDGSAWTQHTAPAQGSGPTSGFPVQPQQDLSGKATTSMVLGLVGIVAWFLPIVGFPVTITGLVFGIKARHSAGRGKAIAGIVLCSIFLTVSVVNAALGAYLRATGRL
jgi:Protein of unknown function (DUF2510)